jgi:two-component system, NtrC family, sensor kinase
MPSGARHPHEPNEPETPVEPGTLESVASGPRDYGAPDPTDLLELLGLATQTDVELGVTGVVEACVERLRGLFRGASVGVSIVQPRPAESLIRCSGPEPAGGPPRPDTTRLFPGQAFERVVHLAGLPGSTLHVAGSDLGMAEAGWQQTRTLEEAGKVVATLVDRALSREQARASVATLRQVEAKLVQAQRLASLGQIVAGVAHEINNPLTSILAYVSLLRRRSTAAPPEEIERLDRIEESAQRILKFTRDVVAYVRPSSPMPAPVSINDVIGKALVFCEHEFSQHGVQVHFDAEQALPPVLGVASQLIQVFVNLFTNAAHAMCESGGHLRISNSPERGALRVEISDTGVGIEAHHHRQVFERFFTTRADGGGLGLSIVRDIVAAHGGEVNLTSVPGQGTTFIVTLPLAAASERLTDS